jgi:glycosyltransferase involved in cell wall biosynthesis
MISVKPLISVILPTYNEASCIEDTLRSLLAQKQEDFGLEILVIDGGSTDKTVDCIARFLADDLVKLLKNPERSAPVAFNLGLRAAAGEYVCILGAHASYAPDYIETCYRELLAHNASGCSGRIVTVPAKQTPAAKLAAWCLGHAFASSPNSVRTQTGGFTETIPYPLFRRAALVELGGYDERLRRNQDNDMNYRLLAAGHRLYLTPRTHAAYLARPDVRTLWDYGFVTGKWNAITLHVSAACMSPRHFAPFAFAICLVTLAMAALVATLAGSVVSVPLMLLGGMLGGHLLLGFVAAVPIGVRERSMAALLLPLVILGFHLAYGLGTLAGFLSMLRGISPAANTARVSVAKLATPVSHGTSTTAR